MTDDEKKALIVAGSVAAIGLAIWLTRGQSLIPPGASNLQPSGSVIPGPGYTTYNVPPFNGTPTSLIYPSYMNDGGNGCCSDGCSTSSGINTGNAPTSLAQLLGWYGNTPGNDNFAAAANAQVAAVSMPQQTIIDQTNIPLANNSLF